MYLAPDDAKSDVILAAATTVFGVALQGFVASLPLYPRQGVLAALLDVAWVLALTALVPWLLSRYRSDGLAAFGLDRPRAALGRGVVLAAPIAIVGITSLTLVDVPVGLAVAGRLGVAMGAGGLGLGVVALYAIAVAIGSLLLVAFLATRSEEGFPRSPDTSLTALVRSVGVGAVGAALVLGLVRSIGPGTVVQTLLNVAAAGALVLLADRMIPTGTTVPRTTVVAPVVVVAVAHVFAAGGLFRGDLLTGLYTAALAAATTVAIAGLARSRTGAWAAVPLVAALAFWPTCLSPLAFDGGFC